MSDGPEVPSPADVLDAAAFLEGKILRTPLLSIPELDRLLGREILLKPENLQHIGAFKARGALFAASRLGPAAAARGLATYSSGNHGQAVALAAKRAGTTALVVMPEDAPTLKIDAVRALGADVVFEGKTTTARRKKAEELAAERGLTVIAPFDDANVIAGQGTATLELIRDAEARGTPVDAIVVPVGGGGLLAGACLAARADGSRAVPRIIAAEPDTANAFQKSVIAGRRVTIAPSSSIADGLRPVEVGELNFEVSARVVSHCIAVTDEAIGLAVVRLLAFAKLLVEPSGACSLAACFASDFPTDTKRVGVVLSGGNVSLELVTRLIEQHRAHVR